MMVKMANVAKTVKEWYFLLLEKLAKCSYWLPPMITFGGEKVDTNMQTRSATVIGSHRNSFPALSLDPFYNQWRSAYNISF